MSKRNRIGAENPNFGDGKTISHGYVVLSSKIWGDNQGRYEHRVIIEESLGRPLENHEIVHHKNGNTQDNRLENLEVLSRQEHNRTHGTGRFLVCLDCGAEKWYSGAMILKLRNQGEDYRCRACSVNRTYEKICQRCTNSFVGGMTARFCPNCVSSAQHKRHKLKAQNT